MDRHKKIIGLDVGGTHTDVALISEKGIEREVKVPTDADNLFHTVQLGLEQVTESIEPREISRAVLSTTLATNAIVQEKKPNVGMIVSAGPGIDPELFRTNAHYYTVSGSIDHRGREIEPVRQSEILTAAEKMKQAGIRNVGIVGKFSVRNPSHEIAIHNMIREGFGKIFMGHRVSGNLNFPRRVATTYLDASVRQVHKKFYEAVRRSLEEKGLSMPIYLLKADGGTMHFDTAIDSPSQTIFSGPAASVMGAISFAPAKGDCLVLDIGGTTTDMAILVNHSPTLEPLGITVGEYKTLIRSLETRSIGIGGDSSVVVENGKIIIGPNRTGPAMAYGGPVPTPTDALFVLGKIENGDREKAFSGIREVADKIGKSVEETATFIFEHSCTRILEEAGRFIDSINSKPVYTVHEILEGYKVSPETILVLGGPAPYFAKQLDAMSGYSVKPVPRWAVANAIGAALARTTCEVAFFADTEREIATAPAEGYTEKVNRNFSKETAIERAFDLLRKKAFAIGANEEDLEMEVIEEQQFNMVRGFYTTGRNIRVKVQVKPGLLKAYERITL